MILLNTGECHKIGEPFSPNIEAVAFSLAHINRYCGHFGVYSVAQHCCLVAEQLPDELKLAGLMHDASEAYIGDVISPVKHRLPEYVTLEKWYHDYLDEFYKIETRHPDVKNADLRMLVTEVRELAPAAYRANPGIWPDVEPYPITIWKWCPVTAYTMFKEKFAEYRAL